MRKPLIIALLLALSCPHIQAQTAHFDVLHYHIALDVDLNKKQLSGTTAVTLRSDVQQLRMVELSLYQLIAKQVVANGQKIRHSQAGDKLLIHINPSLVQGDTLTLHITYMGKPATPSWFGGFYMDDTSAYNLGVWIDGNPPNFGKAWFPCADNFTDKATYSFAITTPLAYKAVCSGEYQGTEPVGRDRHTHRWHLRQPISTYLASVAVGNYVQERQWLHSVSGDTLPADLYVHPHERMQARQHFSGLQHVFTQFEKHFGAYPWPRVGYVAVPMQGGAMEHALNIAYPHSGLHDPSPALWIHELAHSWFGNYVTCKDGGEMWLNEGFARYCELLGQVWLLEHQSPQKAPSIGAFLDDELMGRVLLETHLYDGGHFAVAGIPPSLTYSSTVYDKGATVVHSLRAYLGDSLFFGGLRHYLNKFAWRNVGSNDLHFALSEYSNRDLSHFFDGWVYSAGFPHYAIFDTATVPIAGGGGYEFSLRLRQSTWHKPAPVRHTRVPVRLFLADGSIHDEVLSMRGTEDSFKLKLPHLVVDTWLDPHNQLGDARTGNTQMVMGPAKRVRKYVRGHIAVQSVPAGDTAFVRLQRHFSNPMDNAAIVHPGWWSVQQVGKADYTLHLHYNAADKPKNVPALVQLGLYYQPRLGGNWELIALVPFGQLQHTFELPGKPGNYALRYE